MRDLTMELGNVGLCYGEMGRYEEAIRYLERSLELACRLEAPLPEGLAHHYLGNAYRNSGAAAQAVEHLGADIAIFRELGSRDALAAALADMAAAHIALEQYEEAEAALREGLELETSLARPRGIAFKYLGLGNLRLAQDRLDEAWRHYTRVLAFTEDEVGPSPILNALLGAAVIRARGGDRTHLPAVAATACDHPHAGHETRQNAERWAAAFAVKIDSGLTRKPWALEKLVEEVVAGPGAAA